jgi:hypothetical protein
VAIRTGVVETRTSLRTGTGEGPENRVIR